MAAGAHRAVAGVPKTVAVTSNSGEVSRSTRDEIERGKGGNERGERGEDVEGLVKARGAIKGLNRDVIPAVTGAIDGGVTRGRRAWQVGPGPTVSER